MSDMQMKRFLVSSILAVCAVVSLSGFASADTLGPFNSTISYRLTDFTSGTSGSFLDFSTAPATVSSAGITPYFSLPAFDTLGGTRQLQSVSINYTLRMRTRFAVTNNAAAGSGNLRITSNATTSAALFYNTTGDTAGDQTDLDGSFVKYTTASDIPDSVQGLSVNAPTTVFNNVAPGETRRSAVLNSFATTTLTFDAVGYSSGAAGAITSDTVINGFKTTSVNPVRIGMQTFTEGSVSFQAGGNASGSQETVDQGELIVTYTFQPVPAPPSAVSLGIGGLVGLVGTGVNRLRRRRRVATKTN